MNSEYDYIFTLSKRHVLNVRKINSWLNNNPEAMVLIEAPNTLYLNIEDLKKLNPKVNIRIAGAYNAERLRIYRNDTFKSKDGKQTSNCKEYYYDSVIYSRNETIRILKAIEKIEKGINSRWTNLQKLVYLYTTIKRSIMYDPKFEEKAHRDIRTLRGLITHETVCAGYSLILKELLDRQGIKSYYVKGNAHAWNIVEIEGKLYPIDITHENSKFRSGMDNTFAYFGHNIKSFNANRHPDEREPFKDYEDKLSEFDPHLIEIIYQKIYKEYDYKTTTYLSERDNGEKFLLVQIGTKIIGKEVYYKYYYVNLYGNKLSNHPYILYSKENVCGHIDKVRFTKKKYIEEENALVNFLFSRKNIVDSLNRNTSYIGDFKIRNGIKYLEKNAKDCARCSVPPKVYTRNNGTMFVLENTGHIFIDDIKVYKYNLYQIFFENGKPYLKNNIIYSEKDLLYDDREVFRDVFLSIDRINVKEKDNGGYVGIIDDIGSIKMNTKLVSYFKPSKKNSVAVYEKYKENHIHIPTFIEIEKLYDTYKTININASNCSEAKVASKKNYSIENNTITAACAHFANIWTNAVGVLAFSEGIDEIYSVICENLREDIRNKGFIDTIDLYYRFNDNKFAKQIIINLFNNKSQTNFINDLFLKAYNEKLTPTTEPVVIYNEEVAKNKSTNHKY